MSRAPCFRNCDPGRNCVCVGQPLPAGVGRMWRLTFVCDGAWFVWTGLAMDERAAQAIALDDLDIESAGFDRRTARLVAAIDR